MRLALIGLAPLLAGAAACDDSITATIAPYKVPCQGGSGGPPGPGYTCYLVTDDGQPQRTLVQGFSEGFVYHWGDELRVRYHIREGSNDDPCGGIAFGSCLELDEIAARTPAAAGTSFGLSLPAAAMPPWFEATAIGLMFQGVESVCEPAVCEHVLALGDTAFDVQFEFTGDLAVPLRVLATTP